MSCLSTSHRSLALLVCGKTDGKTLAENGDYVDIYQRYLQASLVSLQGENLPPTKVLQKPNHGPSQPRWQFSLDPYDVFQSQQFPPEAKVNDYHGIIITGSPSSAYENVEWVTKLVAFVKHIADTKPRIKLIGLCFGHQIIARALGGECVPNGGRWELGPTPITLTDLGQQIFGVDTLNIQEMHRDHVPAVHTPSSFHLLGSTELSANQGMVRFLSGADPAATGPALLNQIQILTTQGHPEYTEAIVTSIVEARSQSGSIDAAAADDYNRRRYWPNDGIDVIGHALWGVLGVVRS